MCERKDSGEVQPFPQNFSSRLQWYVTACGIKNEFYTFRNRYIGTILRHHLQEQYQMVCVISTSKPSIRRRSIIILVFTYSMEYLYHHNYKWNLIHITWTSYMEMISSTINLGQIKTATTITPRYYFIDRTPDKIST